MSAGCLLSYQGVEFRENGLDLGRDALQGHAYEASILERYSGGALEVHIHIGIRRNDFSTHATQLCVRLDHQRRGRWQLQRRVLNSFYLDHFAGKLCVLHKDQVKLSVFVAPAQVFHDRQGMVRWRIPTVWLMPYDDCTIGPIDDPGEFLSTSTLEALLGCINGESHLMGLFRDRVVTHQDKLPCQVIQRSPKIHKYIPNNKGPAWSHGINAADAPDKTPALGVKVFFDVKGNGTTLSLDPNPYFCLQSLQVGFRPIELCPRLTEVDWHAR